MGGLVDFCDDIVEVSPYSSIYIYADTLIYLNIKILKKIIELHFVIKNENQPVARLALYASVQYVDTVEYAHASIHT